jgi:hypothetical protein
VHDRNYQNKVRFNCVENAVWKNVRNVTANILVDYAPAGWRFQNVMDRSFDCFDESNLKVWIVFGVISRGGLEFR